MPAFLKLGDIEGEATEKSHSGWINVESMSSAVSRSIPNGAKDVQRSRGQTTVSDIRVVRQADKSTPKIVEACAKGKFFPEAQIEMCTNIDGKVKPYMSYTLKDVIVTSHGFFANAAGDPTPSEEVTLSFTKVEWTYKVLDNKTGGDKATVATDFDPGLGS